MELFDATGAVDFNQFVTYIAKTFPNELKTMIQTRDELAQRQGALSAVADALADRQAAAKELADAKAQAAELIAAAVARDAESNALAALTAESKDSIDAYVQVSLTDLDAREAAADARDAALNAREANLNAKDASVQERKLLLDASEQNLAVRLKSFQDKVAALSA